MAKVKRTSVSSICVIFRKHFFVVALILIFLNQRLSLVCLGLRCPPWTWSRGTTTPGRPCMSPRLKVKRRGGHCQFIDKSSVLISECVELMFVRVCLCFSGHAEVVRFLLEACKVNPVPKDR